MQSSLHSDRQERSCTPHWARSSVMDGAIALSAMSRQVPCSKIESRYSSTPRISMIRPQDHSAADLFGASVESRPVSRPTNSIIPKKASAKAMTPRQAKMNQLQSSIFSHLRQSQASYTSHKRIRQRKPSPTQEEIKPTARPMTKSYSKPVLSNLTASELKKITFNVPSTKADCPNVENIEIRGLKPQEDDFSVKSMCKGIHVINVATDIDNITGKCTGKATVTIRGQSQYRSLEKLKLQLAQKGLTVKNSCASVGKKNNYLQLSHKDFLDNQIERETKRPSSIVSKPHLCSSDDVYGSSPGVGRFTGLRSYNK